MLISWIIVVLSTTGLLATDSTVISGVDFSYQTSETTRATLSTVETSDKRTSSRDPGNMTTTMTSSNTSTFTTDASEPSNMAFPVEKTVAIVLGGLFLVACLVILYMCNSRRDGRNQSSSMIFIHHIDDHHPHHDATSTDSDQVRTIMMDTERCSSLRNPLAVAMSSVAPHLMNDSKSNPKIFKENVAFGQPFNHSFKDSRRISRSLETVFNPPYDSDESEGGFWIDCHMSEEDISINLKKKRGSQSNSVRSATSHRGFNQRSSGRFLTRNQLWNNPLFRSAPSLSNDTTLQGLEGFKKENYMYEDMSSPHQSSYGMPPSYSVSNTYDFASKSDDGKHRKWPLEKNLSSNGREEPPRHLPINFDDSPEAEHSTETTSCERDTLKHPTARSPSPDLQGEPSTSLGTTVADMSGRPLPPIPEQKVPIDLPPTPQESRHQGADAPMLSRNESVKSIVSERRVRFEEGW